VLLELMIRKDIVCGDITCMKNRWRVSGLKMKMTKEGERTMHHGERLDPKRYCIEILHRRQRIQCDGRKNHSQLVQRLFVDKSSWQRSERYHHEPPPNGKFCR